MAFDRDWHAALWTTMKKYNISANLIRVIKNFHDRVTSAVLLNRGIEETPQFIIFKLAIQALSYELGR